MFRTETCIPFYLLGLRLSSKFTNPKCLLRHTVSYNLKGMYRLNHILEGMVLLHEGCRRNGVSTHKEAQRGQFESSKTWSKNVTANVLVRLPLKISWSSDLSTKLHF